MDYGCAALHQVNLFMMKQIARKLGMRGDKLLMRIGRYGNTGSASISAALTDRYAG